MDVKIVLSREKKYWRYGPGDRVEGKLLVNNPNPVYSSGIRISLEAIVRVNFRDSDGRAITKVENAINPNVFTYVWPINWSWSQITGKFDEERQARLPASKHVFPFSFHYPATPLPATFCSEYGSVKHQVVVSLMTPTQNHQLATHPLTFADHLNLLQDPMALKPLKLEKRKKSLMFSLVHPSSSSASPLHFSLKMQQRGYLPGEYATFKFTLINLTGKSLARVTVSLIQKVSYHGEKVKKLLCSVLDEAETREVDGAVETIWESGLAIPEDIKPTFYKCCIEHQYFIKVQIYSKGSSTRPTLKGHIPIIVGTVRDLDGQSMCYRCRGVENGDEGGCSRLSSSHQVSSTSRGHALGRRTSLDLTRGSLDVLSFGGERSESPSMMGDIFSPPPSYSQLSSRAGSIDSFLPLYEDAMHSGKGNVKDNPFGRKKSAEENKI